MSFQECIYTAICTAIALQSIRLFQSLLHRIAVFLAHPPLPVCVYIEPHFYSRSILHRYGSLLSAVEMGLNIPSGVTLWPTHGNEIGQIRLQLPPCALHGSNVSNEALTDGVYSLLAGTQYNLIMPLMMDAESR